MDLNRVKKREEEKKEAAAEDEEQVEAGELITQ